ncbi:uncharacterized protein LOC103572238 [Microplitis demolitor]|uniref:uncharacterized protein LOC103572238 n=1 Tax=Microplitis demolitor TaxID=69319 RepID=UPI0004CD6C95|nr:uncharacterized protein LOC103572238 [Microplitis demolitor]
MEEESVVATAKLSRKNKKQSELKSKKQKIDEIIKVHKEKSNSNNHKERISNEQKVDSDVKEKQLELNLSNDYDNIQVLSDSSTDKGEFSDGCDSPINTRPMKTRLNYRRN